LTKFCGGVERGPRRKRKLVCGFWILYNPVHHSLPLGDSSCTSPLHSPGGRFEISDIMFILIILYYHWRHHFSLDRRVHSSQPVIQTLILLDSTHATNCWRTISVCWRQTVRENCTPAQCTFFNPWFRTAHRHLMTLDFAPMTNFCSIKRSWIYHSHAPQRQLLITTCTLDYVLVCLFCYRLCISCHKLRLSAFFIKNKMNEWMNGH